MSESAQPGTLNTQQLATQTLLVDLLERANRGELTDLVIGYVTSKGGASVVSTPIAPMVMNHLATLIDRRVAREYDRAMAAAASPRAPSGGIPVNAPKQELPRAVRRQIKKAQGKLAKKALEEAKAPAVSDG